MECATEAADNFRLSLGGKLVVYAAQRTLLALRELLAWTIRVASPWPANSRSQNARAKKPRSSPRFSRSIRNAPLRGVSVKIMSSPCQLKRWNRPLSVRRRTN